MISKWNIINNSYNFGLRLYQLRELRYWSFVIITPQNATVV